jgi:hypothetical protein
MHAEKDDGVCKSVKERKARKSWHPKIVPKGKLAGKS